MHVESIETINGIKFQQKLSLISIIANFVGEIKVV